MFLKWIDNICSFIIFITIILITIVFFNGSWKDYQDHKRNKLIQKEKIVSKTKFRIYPNGDVTHEDDFIEEDNYNDTIQTHDDYAEYEIPNEIIDYIIDSQ